MTISCYEPISSSKAQGQIGEKITIDGVVYAQDSIPIYTAQGTVYSHVHLLKDDQGNIYKYKGSTHLPKGSRVRITATVKTYYRDEQNPRSMITVLRAPKLVK
jgi:hypothetical protein